MVGIVVNLEEQLINFRLNYFRYEMPIKQLYVEFGRYDEFGNVDVYANTFVLYGDEAKTLYNKLKQNGISELYIELCNQLKVDSSVVPANMESEL